MIIKENIVFYAKLLDKKGLVNPLEGNISVYDRDNNKLYITPSGTRKSLLTEKDIAVFEGRNQIYFEKFYMNALYPGTKEADTTRTSFFFFPDIMTPPLLQLFSSFLTRTASGFWDQQTHSTNLRSGS